jgi:HD-like signal output (HDOD) protein
MLKAVLFLLIVGALTGMILSALRRSSQPRPDKSLTEVAVGRAASPAPVALPAPPAADEFGGGALDRDAVFRKLYELALVTTLRPSIGAEHAKVVAATAAALKTAATEPRYAPRRPMLLPQLLRAVGDSETSRGELAEIISRDPSLVGNLLKLANSPFYRVGAQPVESIDRAIAVMGTEGIRTLIAAALIQPVFRSAGKAAFGRFPEVIWEHAHHSAAAAEVHAAAIERADLFAAQLIALVTGLGAIVVFRVAQDQYASRPEVRPDATAIATLLDEHTAEVALRIAASWELSPRILEALEDQLPGKPAHSASSLGRSLRFGLVAGALTVLVANEVIDENTGLASVTAAGGTGPRFERMWALFTTPARNDEA